MPVSIKVPVSGGRVRTHLNGLILDRGMDGYAVPQFSPEVYRSGEEMAIPMIVGTTGRESGGPPGSGPGTAPGTGAVPGPGGRGANRSPEGSMWRRYPHDFAPLFFVSTK